jgi:aspartyl-tRNA(Asn)/glutamyl-tRNA(Gln) amidotransferase subunit C
LSLSRDDLRKVALLSRLELGDDELDRQTERINTLLGHFEALQKLNLEGVEPTSHSFPVFNVMRDDVTRPSLAREDTLSNAPSQRDGCFVVPRILE